MANVVDINDLLPRESDVRYDSEGRVVLQLSGPQKETVLHYNRIPILLANEDWLGIFQEASIHCALNATYTLSAIRNEVIAYKGWAVETFGELAFARAVRSFDENCFTIE